MPSGDERIATLELDATSPVAFGFLRRIRELSDGRILAADPTGQVLLRLDLDAGTADTIGRQGEGPQEYESPDEVFPLPGDSTLLVDLGNGRFIVIDPEGSFVDWTPITSANELSPLGTRTVLPEFVDMAGNFYVTAPFYFPAPPESTAIHRIDRTTGVETPIAWVWHPQRVGYARGTKRRTLVPVDDWTVGHDGRVAVVRANRNSVDWYFPDGRVIQGTPNDIERFPIRRRDKEAEVEDWNASVLRTQTFRDASGTRIMRMSRGLPAGMRSTIEDFEWPEMFPVFRPGHTVVSPRGEAWVHRYMPADGPGRIDVFDHHAIRIGFIELNPRSRVIDFGADTRTGPTVYVTRTDDMGLIWLERYRVLRSDE